MHAPLREKRVRANNVPWKTTKINDLMEQKDIIKLLAQKRRCKDLYNEYKKLLNNVNSVMRKRKASHYKSLIQENIYKLDRLRKAIKEILPSCKKTETIVTLTDELGIYKDPEGVASCFNKFFSTIGNKLSQCFSNQTLPSNNPYNNISSIFNFKPISHDFTSKQLLSLNTKKASGLENINLRPL